MDNWQQFAFREDPYPEIPFDVHEGLPVDSLVGAVCLLAALVACIV